jgi:hypothetical protein
MGAKSFEVSNFPTTIITSCEIQEIKKDTSLTRLPQLNKDFVQNQFNTEILTQTPNIVKNPILPGNIPQQCLLL